jgi:hypothetical protein
MNARKGCSEILFVVRDREAAGRPKLLYLHVVRSKPEKKNQQVWNRALGSQIGDG